MGNLCVYCEVGTEFLRIIQLNSGFKVSEWPFAAALEQFSVQLLMH
jgi:hypothetical protein